MRLMRDEDKAYKAYVRRINWMADSWEWEWNGVIEEAKDEAWNIAMDMLWDALHNEDGTAWREYDELSSLIWEAHKAMESQAVIAIDSDGEWLSVEMA